MPAPMVTTQISTVDASSVNAPNVNTFSQVVSLLGTDDGSGPAAPTPAPGVQPGAPAVATVSGTSSTTPPWVTYLFVFALAYFGWKYLE